MNLETLNEYLKYQENGEFIWVKKTPKNKSIILGEVAGSVRADGYKRIRLLDRLYLTHHLVWLFHKNKFPELDIDHIDGNPSNNRIENLREVTRSVNGQNLKKARSHNSTGYLGVHKSHSKYEARCVANGTVYRKRFDNPEEASEYYLSLKRKLHEGNTL